MLAVTLWGELENLVVDTPPGIGDAMLDLVRLIPRIEFLIVTTPSQLAFETVKKQVCLLKELKVPIIGVVENMKMINVKTVQHATEALGVKFLAEIPYDPSVESAIGQPQRLMATSLGKTVAQIAQIV
jgi:ATP-binding protein involved in chromosome partitioning